MLDDPLGDAILTLPIIHSLNEYIKYTGQSKKITVVYKNKELFKSVEGQFSNTRVISQKELGTVFENGPQNVFVFNTSKTFKNYSLFKISEEDAKLPSNVMSVDWASWKKQEAPVTHRLIVKYDPLPARVARGMEIMVGRKLFKDLKNTPRYIERGPNFDVEAKEIRNKYNISPDEEIYVIAPGSAITAKEYAPEKMREVIDGIYKKHPKAHVLFLDDPDPVKKARYGAMVDICKQQTG